MDVDQEKLAALYVAGTEPGDRSLCLSADELALAAGGRLAPSDRERVAQHLGSCSACAAEMRVARGLETWAMRGEEPRQVRPRPARWAFGLAALLVLGIGGAIVWRRSVTPSPDTETRGEGAPTQAPVDPPHGAALKEPPRRLAWTPESPGRHRVLLFDSAAGLVWESPWTVGDSLILPDEVRARIGHGRPYYWRVVSEMGIERRQSSLHRFSVMP